MPPLPPPTPRRGGPLEADPKLVDDRQAQHRYNAACAAALASSGQGKEEPALDEAARDRLLHPLEILLEGLPRVALDTGAALRFAHGQAVPHAGERAGRCQVWDPANRLLGLGELAQSGELRPVRLLASAATPARQGAKTL